ATRRRSAGDTIRGSTGRRSAATRSGTAPSYTKGGAARKKRRGCRSPTQCARFRVTMRILYAVCGWGLGHATRSLPVLRRLVAERLTEAVTWRAIHGRYRRILVPDVAEDGGLSGRLAHGLHFYGRDEIRYVGPMSDVTPQPVTRDVDTLVVLSGPEPSRSRLE